MAEEQIEQQRLDEAADASFAADEDGRPFRELERVGRAVSPLHDRSHTASVRQRDATLCPLAILPT